MTGSHNGRRNFAPRLCVDGRFMVVDTDIIDAEE